MILWNTAKKTAWLFILIFTILFTAADSAPLYILPGDDTRIDRLATDERAASYRMGEIDPFIEKVPASLEDKVFSQPHENLPELAAILKKNAHNDFHLAKLIHDWITNHIAYDYDLFYGLPGADGSRKTYTLLPLKRTTCGGYSALYKEIADLAGLECVKITGYSKTYWIKSSDRLGTHAWNAVRIQGKWYIVDSTANGRLSYKNGQRSEKKEYSDTQLFIKAEAKILVNFPKNSDQQFLKKPITKEQFLSRPQFNINYYMFNSIQFSKNSLAIIKKSYEKREGGKLQSIYDSITVNGSSETISLTAPDTVAVKVSLYKKDDNDNKIKYPDHAYIETDGHKRIIHFNTPDKDNYFLSIYIRDRTLNNSSRSIYRLRIIGKSTGKRLPSSGTPFMQDEGFYYDLKLDHFSKPTADFPYYTMLIKHPDDVEVWTGIYSRDHIKIKDRISYSYEVGAKRYYISAPMGQHWIKVYGKKKGTDKYNYSALHCRIEHTNSTNPQLPPPERLINKTRWLEYGLQSQSKSGNRVIPQNGIYTVKVKAPQGVIPGALIQDENNKTIKNHSSYITMSDGWTRFSFSSPGKGQYYAKICIINPDGKWNSAQYFSFPSDSKKGPLLPVHLQVTENSRFKTEGFIHADSKVVTIQPGIFSYTVTAPAGYAMSCRLRDMDDKKLSDNSTYSTSDGKTFRFYFTVPDNKRYLAKMYGIDPENNWNRVAMFAIEEQKKSNPPLLPFPGKLFIYRKFHEYGLKMVDHTISKTSCRITIECSTNSILKGSLKNASGKKERDYYSENRTDNRYTFEATIPGDGRYNARIWVKNKGEYSDKSEHYFKYTALEFVLEQ